MTTDNEMWQAVVLLTNVLDPVPPGLVDQVRQRVAAEIAPPSEQRRTA